MINKQKETDFNPITQVKEYKRTCNECGKVWHSLASREEKIEQQKRRNSCNELTAAWGMCGGSWSALGAATQAERNEHALDEELGKLKKCPNCGSHNYKEKILIYDKK
jgi:hypothetical protein